MESTEYWKKSMTVEMEEIYQTIKRMVAEKKSNGIAPPFLTIQEIMRETQKSRSYVGQMLNYLYLNKQIKVRYNVNKQPMVELI